MQPSFQRLGVSGHPVFSELHDFNRSVCFNARAVARKQRQVLEKLKKTINLFFEMRFNMQPSFLRLGFSGFPVFCELHDFNGSLCFNARAVARKQRQVLEKLAKNSFSQNEISRANDLF